MPLSDYTTAELELMLLKHQERRVIFTQMMLKQIKAEIEARKQHTIGR